MSLLTHEENKKLNRIIDLEGKIIEFMKHNSAIVSIETGNEKYDAFHIQLIEIFSYDKYPIGQSLELNKSEVIKLFMYNQNMVRLLKNYIDKEGIILILIGENYDDKPMRYIWDGKGKIPWKIDKVKITKNMADATGESAEKLLHIIKNIRYKPYEIRELKDVHDFSSIDTYNYI